MDRERRGPKQASWRDQFQVRDQSQWATEIDISPPTKATKSSSLQDNVSDDSDGNVAVSNYI
jgi:hypothetical protein